MITRSVAVADTARARQGELLRAISKLQDNVKGTKVAQDKKIKEVREMVTKDVKKDITKMVE